MNSQINKLDLGKTLVKDFKPKNNNKKVNKVNNTPVIAYSDLFNIFQYNKERSQITESIFDILPNLKLAMEIVVSSILSPNEMRDAVLTYSIDAKYTPTTLTSVISNKIKQYISTTYKIENKLYNIISESMFLNGSYVELIVPSKFIEEKYKELPTLESWTDTLSKINIGFINHIEDKETNIEITDNIDILFAKNKFEKYKSIKNRSLVSSIESDKLGMIEDILYIDSDTNPSEVPITKKLNGDAVIPIASPDEPNKHYGYFILLDEKGNTLKRNEYQIHDNIKNLLNGSKVSQMDKVLNRVKRTLQLNNKKEPELKDINKIKEMLIYSKIKEATKNTGIDELLDRDEIIKSDVFDILLTRILENKKTKILYVPKELIVYYAYEYRKNGTGRSLLEHVLILASLRVITMFSSLYAYVRSNIHSTKVTADIDEQDPDPSRTMEKIKAEVVRNREFSLPIGLLKIQDITTWLHKTGYSFVFNGANLPNTKVDVSEEPFEINPVNSDLDELLDKFIYNTFGLTPEQLNEAESANFATTIIASNRLFARRIDMYQRVYNKHITDHITKLLYQDGVIKNEIKDIILSPKNKKEIKSYIKSIVSNKEQLNKIMNLDDDSLFELIYIDILSHLKVTLPQPVVTDTDTIAEMYKNFKDNLEDMLDTLISQDFFPEDIVEGLADKIDNIKNILKAVILIDWSNEHGYMGEVTKLFTTGKDGKPVMAALEEYTVYIDMWKSTIIPFLQEINKKKTEIAKDLNKIENTDVDEKEANEPEDTRYEDNDNNKEEENDNEEENNNEEEENNNEENENSDIDKDIDNMKV